MRQTLTEIPESLWELAHLADSRVLAVDCDLAVGGHDLLASGRSTTELLKDIACSARTTVAVTSAQPVAELATLLGTAPVTFIGEHGWERKEPGERIVTFSPRPNVADALNRAAQRLPSKEWGVRLTRTRTSVLVWTDELPIERRALVARACRNLWDAELRVPQVRFLRFHSGLEIRAIRRNVGTALLGLMSRARTGTLFVYVGDDVRDEDAFEVLLDCGYAIRVGGLARPSLACGWLKSTDDVAEFLHSWLTLT